MLQIGHSIVIILCYIVVNANLSNFSALRLFMFLVKKTSFGQVDRKASMTKTVFITGLL